MKKVTYGLGLLASAIFAVAMAHAQSGGGAGGGGGGGSAGSASAGAAGTGTAGGTTGTGAAGSSGVGASSPSNLNTGGAGATGTGAGAAGTRATGARVGTGAAGAPGFSMQGTGAGGAAGTTGGFGTSAGRASAGAAGAQNAQPGGTGLGTSGAAGSRLGTGAAGTGLGTDAAGTTGTTGGVGGFDTSTGVRSNTTFDTLRSPRVQDDFNQRTTVEQQRLIDQQRAGLRTQQGDFNRTRSDFSDDSTVRTDAGIDRDVTDADASLQPSQRAVTTTGAPGELGVFINDAGERGVRVSRIVDGSAAALAGLQPGDIIVGVNERLVAAPGDLTRLIRAIPAGEVAQLQVIRDGAEYDVDATLMPFRDRSVAVGYRGTTSTTASGDLAARVSRLEEQLAMVLDELQSVRREVVVLRGGSGEAELGARFSERETGTSLNGEFGGRSTSETDAQFEQRETQRGIGVGTEFDQRSSTDAGIGTDVNERDSAAGVDARSRTDAGPSSTGSRLPPPPAPSRSNRNATGEGASQSSGANDDLFGTSDRGANQSDANPSATENEQDQQSTTDADTSLPF